MERKKIMTAVLLIAVVIIWGVIILKVVHGNRPPQMPIVKSTPEKPVDKGHKDSLRLDYRDPFIGDFVRAKPEKKAFVPHVKVVRKEPEHPPVPDFTFKGLIGNGSVQRAMVLKNGNLHMLSIGEMIGEFKVEGIFPEYMIVRSGRFEIEVKVR
ncbi:MAG: hypothetical protein K1V99_11590 [Bacteroidales bacterium]|nr:hypothetical protein [Bacteroidales bacterium]